MITRVWYLFVPHPRDHLGSQAGGASWPGLRAGQKGQTVSLGGESRGDLTSGFGL
jgi:hypothetical protein